MDVVGDGNEKTIYVFYGQQLMFQLPNDSVDVQVDIKQMIEENANLRKEVQRMKKTLGVYDLRIASLFNELRRNNNAKTQRSSPWTAARRENRIRRAAASSQAPK